MTKEEYEKFRRSKFKTDDVMRRKKRGRYFSCGAKDKRTFGKLAFAPSRGTMNGLPMW